MPKIQTIRSSIAAKIAGVAGFSEARVPYSGFARTAQTVAHKRFALATIQSTAADSRHRAAEGVNLRTEISIRFAYRLRPRDAYPTDYDLALEEERKVISAVLTGDYSGTIPKAQLSFLESRREAVPSGEWIIIETKFKINHFLPI